MEQDIFQFAIDAEDEAEKYYRDLSEKTNHTGMKNILIRLAEEEVRHSKIIDDMAAGKDELPAETKVLPEVKEMFAKFANADLEPAVSAVDIYKKARQFEIKSRDFYLDKASQVTDAKQKEILNFLANEEKKHAFLLDNIIEFVSRPVSWLEDAEFNHLDDY